MKNRKVVFIDYDGTLYDHNVNKVHDEVIDLLKKAKATNNVDIYLTTGRPMVYLKYKANILENLKGIISANGSSIDIDGRNIFDVVIDKENLRNLFEYSNENNISILFFEKENVYINFKDEELTKRFTTNNEYPIFKINKFNEIKGEVNQVCIFASNEVIDGMKPQFPKLEIYKWGKSGGDIVLKGISKGNAIKKVIEMNNYKFENTYGIGDGENDIPMFNSVYYPIAMGNASDETKKYAKEITDRIEEKGLEKVLDKIIKLTSF